MKRTIIGLLLLLMIGCGPCKRAWADAGDDQKKDEDMVTITVPKSSLTPQQQLSAQQQEIHSWVGIGKEVGEAVNSSLQAVTTQSNNFAQTNVGKLTVAVVIWKVVGGDALHIVFGVGFGLFALPFWIWSYRKMCIPRKLLSKETIAPDKTVVRDYTVVNQWVRGGNNDELIGWRLGHWAGMCAIVVVMLVSVWSY